MCFEMLRLRYILDIQETGRHVGLNIRARDKTLWVLIINVVVKAIRLDELILIENKKDNGRSRIELSKYPNIVEAE